MTERNWKPIFRTPRSTVTKVLRSNAFLHSRERSAAIVDSAEDLRALADMVETLDHESPPLAAVADRIVAAVRFLRDRADRLDDAAQPADGDAGPATGGSTDGPTAGVVTRERLLVAGLHYLVTPVDLVPDFQAGGYTDDVFLLAWVFGVASTELTPYLTDGAEDGERHP
jgi:hypothetical protein